MFHRFTFQSLQLVSEIVNSIDLYMGSVAACQLNATTVSTHSGFFIATCCMTGTF